MATALLLFSALAVQAGADDASAKLSAWLAEYCPELPEPVRRDAAGRFARSLLAAREHGHEPDRVLRHVEFQIREGMAPVRMMERQARMLGSGLEKWVPDAAARMKFPAEAVRAIAAAQVDVVDAYLSEALARPAAGEEQKREIRAQLEELRGTAVEALKTRVSGPYRDGVVGHAVDHVVKDQGGELLGDPVLGTITRPLTPAELDRLKTAIREAAARSPAVEASHPADKAFAETGEPPQGDETPAQALAFDLANSLYAFGAWNYPRLAQAHEAEDLAVTRALDWVRETWRPIEKELERQRAAFTPPVFPDAPRRKSSAFPGTAPVGKAGATDGPPTATSPSTSGEPSGRSRLVWGVAIAILAILAWALWRGARKNSAR